MKFNVIDAFYKDEPVVICTTGSYIAKVNPDAAARLTHFFEGEKLFDHMDPSDVLKFDAHFYGDADDTYFSFPLTGFHGFVGATAVFERMMGRRYAVVFLSRKLLDAPLSVEEIFGDLPFENTSANIMKFARIFREIPDSCFDKADREGLTDIKSATFKAFEAMNADRRFSHMKIKYSANSEMQLTDTVPQNIPLSTYIEMMALLLSAASEITVKRVAEVNVSKLGERAEISVTTDASRLNCRDMQTNFTSRLMPGANECIEVCKYIARLSHSALNVKMSKDMDEISFVLSIDECIHKDADFKSRDHLMYFTEGLEFALRYISAMVSRNA